LERPGIIDITAVVGRNYRDAPLVIGEQSAQAVMGMDQIRPERPEGFHQCGELLEIAGDAFAGDAEVLTIDTLLAYRFHLLRDERSIMAIFAAGDD
jgi:hypothetical protein